MKAVRHIFSVLLTPPLRTLTPR